MRAVYWTNTGVHVFLVMSGYLMGQMDIDKWGIWFKRRFVRLIPAYYTILVMTAIAYWLFLNENIVDNRFVMHFSTLHFLFFPGYDYWGGHLWYITSIVLCYSVFPILYKAKQMPFAVFVIFILFITPLILYLVCTRTILPYRLSGDIYAFVVGFAIAHLFKYKPPFYLTVLSIFLTVMIIAFQKIAILNNSWSLSYVNTAVNYIWIWIKCLCGVSIFLLFYSPIFNKMSHNKLVDFIDKYSYEIYLSHKNFILGALSLLYVTQIQAVNIIIAILCSLLCAVFLQRITRLRPSAYKVVRA